MYPCTFANFWNRLLRSAKHLQAHQGHAEQVRRICSICLGRQCGDGKSWFTGKITFGPYTDSANLKYNGGTDLFLSGSRSKVEGRVWASKETKINWNKERHLDDEKKKELCKSNDISNGTKSILAESQVLDPGKRFESSPWNRSTLNRTLTIHWERTHVCVWISSPAGLLLRG